MLIRMFSYSMTKCLFFSCDSEEMMIIDLFLTLRMVKIAILSHTAQAISIGGCQNDVTGTVMEIVANEGKVIEIMVQLMEWGGMEWMQHLLVRTKARRRERSGDVHVFANLDTT